MIDVIVDTAAKRIKKLGYPVDESWLMDFALEIIGRCQQQGTPIKGIDVVNELVSAFGQGKAIEAQTNQEMDEFLIKSGQGTGSTRTEKLYNSGKEKIVSGKELNAMQRKFDQENKTDLTKAVEEMPEHLKSFLPGFGGKK